MLHVTCLAKRERLLGGLLESPILWVTTWHLTLDRFLHALNVFLSALAKRGR